MTRTLRSGMLTVLLMMILAACGTAPAAVQPTGEAMADKPTGETMMHGTGEAMADKPSGETMMQPTGEVMADQPAGEIMMQPTSAAMANQPTGETMMQPTGAAMADQPAWMALPLTDVQTGEGFTLGDFAGRPVYVEPMATWCHNCRAQLASVQQAATTLQGQPPVFVALSVETTLPPEQLAQYAAANGFALRFAVASPELLQALVDTFGRTITNPPSTPHFIIAPDGSHGELLTGFRSADEIVALLQAAGGEG
ncbi:MAG: TlpA family protein disulfide reductase [Chloroflexales bacterium]|nr:TlpA family protein disulfide reductase [Chloroflexales bacterium]